MAEEYFPNHYVTSKIGLCLRIGYISQFRSVSLGLWAKIVRRFSKKLHISALKTHGIISVGARDKVTVALL